MLGDLGPELSSKRAWGGLRGANISDRMNQHLLFQPGRPQQRPEFTLILVKSIYCSPVMR